MYTRLTLQLFSEGLKADNWVYHHSRARVARSEEVTAAACTRYYDPGSDPGQPNLLSLRGR